MQDLFKKKLKKIKIKAESLNSNSFANDIKKQVEDTRNYNGKLNSKDNFTSSSQKKSR